MSRSHQALGIVLITMFGLWGCSRAPSDTATAEKLKAVEAKLTRLEDDFRLAASSRDQLRKKLAQAEDAQTALQNRFDELAKDIKLKDELVQKRTGERDQLNVQYEEFRKNIRELIGKAEAALPRAEGSVPAIPTSNKKPDVPELTIPTIQVPQPNP
jgi:chromosome segregation ATPase